MKRIYKALPCLLASAFVLSAACGCKNGVSDMRRRERMMRERRRAEERQEQNFPAEESTPDGEELDPDFMVDPEEPECPDCPKPEEPEKPRDGNDRIIPNDPNFKRPSFEGPEPEPSPEPKPKPVPFPLPHD